MAAAAPGGLERRTIDVVPDSERHGRPLNQFTLWFGANMQITAIVDGVTGWLDARGADEASCRRGFGARHHRRHPGRGSSATPPCVSHFPAEFAERDDCLAGVRALADVTRELAT